MLIFAKWHERVSLDVEQLSMVISSCSLTSKFYSRFQLRFKTLAKKLEP